MRTAAADDAIIAEPLSPAVGLELQGVALDALTDELRAMILDMWQLSGALLFRGCDTPRRNARSLAEALAGDRPITANAFDPVSDQWMMIGADTPEKPPFACIAAAIAPKGVPALWLAGMEAAADTLRLTRQDVLAEAEGKHFAHAFDGPMQPVLQRHPLTGETVLYPPPRRRAGSDQLGLLLDRIAEEPLFCYRHVWQKGDVLAWDPMAVRSRWEAAPGDKVGVFAAQTVPTFESYPGELPL